jgi:hypothetical protein
MSTAGAAQRHSAQHSTAQHSTAQHSTAQHSTAQHSTAQHSTAQQRRAVHNPPHLDGVTTRIVIVDSRARNTAAPSDIVRHMRRRDHTPRHLAAPPDTLHSNTRLNHLAASVSSSTLVSQPPCDALHRHRAHRCTRHTITANTTTPHIAPHASTSSDDERVATRSVSRHPTHTHAHISSSASPRSSLSAVSSRMPRTRFSSHISQR